MSRMTHFTNQSKTILFWDYYILCRLDTEAAMILQRLEYWDGVKNGSNVISERINDVLVSDGGKATQDTSQFFYKSQDELKWELMGLVATNHLGIKLKTLTTELPFVVSRNNPVDPTDRKKQYHMAVEYVQVRLDYLAHILATFKKSNYKLDVVCYAIEDLVSEKVYVEDLDIIKVVKKLLALCRQAEIDDIKAVEDRERHKLIPKGEKKPKAYDPELPKFLRIELKKIKPLVENIDLSSESPNFTFKEWESLSVKNDQTLKLKTPIPQNQRISSNYVSSNYNQKIQDSKCVEASDSLIETVKHTPIDSDLNPLGMKIPETPMPKREIPTEEPFENLPWGAKKALDTTEAIVNTTYTNVNAALRTCQKILDTYHPTEEEYIGVVDKARVWYEANNRILQPINLLALDKDGQVWFDKFLGEFRRYGFNGKVSSQSQEPEVYPPSNGGTENDLPGWCIDAIESVGDNFGCSDFIDDSVRNIFSVYQQAMQLGISLDVFKSTFKEYFKEICALTEAQVGSSGHLDHLDYLCRAMQARLARWEQSTPVVEGALVQN